MAFQVHKIILAGRSPVFEKMLTVDMKEKKEGVVKIIDMSKETLEAMLEFLYTSKCSNFTENPEAVYAAAHAYQIAGFKSLIGKELGKTLTKENVCERLMLSDLYSEENLKQKCLTFIVKNVDDIIFSAPFKDIADNRPSVYYDVI